MEFWLVAGGMVLVVAATLALTIWRGNVRDETEAEMGLQVYRDQMAEVDRDLARGVLSPEAAERTRTEIGRRILAADKARGQQSAARRAPFGARVAALVLILAAGTGSLLVYVRVGAPGYPDMSMQERIDAAAKARADRMSQTDAEAITPPLKPETTDPRLPELLDKLRTVMKTRPDDIKGLRLLARNEAAMGNFAAARKAQQHLVSLLGDKATVEDLVELIDDMAVAAGGRVTPQADPYISRVLDMDPKNGPARYYLGLLNAQTGRPDLAFALWRRLLDEGPQDAPWIKPIRASIRELAALAGDPRYEPPPVSTGPGPSASDMANAAKMTPDQRKQMIQSMVDRLNQRLASEGGTADDWARLINALGVLGETDRAKAIWQEAETTFASNPDDLAKVRAAAEKAGVAGGQDAGEGTSKVGGGDQQSTAPGPSAADVSAAAAMSGADRMQMIQGMVDRLSDRLTTQGGTPEEWARLIHSLGVLGEKERASQIWAKAQTVFAGDPEKLATVKAAANGAGVVQ